MTQKDPFYQYRQSYKGVYIATASPSSKKVLAKGLDYRTLEENLAKKGLADKEGIAIQYLEPKKAICAYSSLAESPAPDGAGMNARTRQTGQAEEAGKPRRFVGTCPFRAGRLH